MKKHILRILSAILCVSLLCGCHSSETTAKKRKKVTKSEKTEKTTSTDEPTDTVIVTDTDPTDTSPSPTSQPSAPGSITNMNLYIGFFDKEISDTNEIREEIANLTGVRLSETYLTTSDPKDAVSAILASGLLPDMMYCGSEFYMLYDAQVLVAWDDYLADPAYSNLRDLYSDKEWELFRQPDGHIYWANAFNSSMGETRDVKHDEIAFWIQVRVLEWAGYPQIETLDEYFDLIESFYAANQYNVDGTPIIPYTFVNEDWRNFALTNPPVLLDGYANDMVVGVDDSDPDHPFIVDCNISDTAKTYYKTLNEAYKKGLVDPDFAVMSYDQYTGKIASGAVLGVCDAYWDFDMFANSNYSGIDFDGLGYEYVPLGLTLEKGKENRWHANERLINSSEGIAVTTGCSDPALAFSFLNRILDQDILNLRFWGIEDVDYAVDADGLFYRTDEMRDRWNDYSYQYDHVCQYKYLPKFGGTSRDGLNAMFPDEQPSEVMNGLSERMRNCFDAYGYSTYCDFLHSSDKETGRWYPMYQYANMLTTGTAAGDALYNIKICQAMWLAQLVISNDFESDWDKYVKEYNKCLPQDFLDDMQAELDRIVAES